MRIIFPSIAMAALVLVTGCQTRHDRDRYTYRAPIIESGPTAVVQVPSAADRALADLVRSQFNRYGDLAKSVGNVHVDARNGMVTLTGTIPSSQDRKMIAAIAENTPGVVTLNDQLQLSAAGSTVTLPTGRIDTPRVVTDAGDMFNLHVQGLSDQDRLLAQRVLDGLRTDSVVASTVPVVNIDVANGRVVLRGSVLSDEQRRSIVSAVQRAAGVNNVIDELRVR
jgi:osmotically-inducible protein OsmY